MNPNNSYSSATSSQQQLRSREERLKELERERAIFASSKSVAISQPSSSSNQRSNTFASTSTSRFDKKDDVENFRPSGSSQLQKQDSDNVCFANQMGGIKSRLRVGPNGKHTFVDDEIERIVDRDLALGGTDWKDWQRERELREREFREQEKEKELLRKELELTKRERDLERERDKAKSATAASSATQKSLSSSVNGKGKETEAAKKKAAAPDAWKQIVAKESKTRTKVSSP
jgi:hypothetical protein